jgi:putative PIG3 family NAD(P)H quinone oxidoreductase
LPPLKSGEVLIRIAAAGVNRPDVVQRQGLYPAPPGASDLPGLEVAGHVVALDPEVSAANGTTATGPWRVGDAVCALVNGGGYAEYVAVPGAQCLPVPSGLGMAEAAALPETCFTVWSNVSDRAAPKPGESLLVHGGSSGIGTTAIQIARALGARVIVTAGSKEKCDACVALGADRAVNYREEDFVEAAKAFTNGKGVDVVLDMVGGDYVAKNISALAQDGRLVFIAFLKGAKMEVNLMPVMMKRLTVTGSTLRARTDAAKAAIAAALRAKVWPLIDSGVVKPVIHTTFPLAEAAEAHRLMESSEHIGKIVLTV